MNHFPAPASEKPVATIEFQISAAQPTAEKSEPPAQPDPPDETEANIEAFLDCF